MSWFFLRDCKQTVSIRRAMCRACSSWKTVSDSPSQSLTARKSIALSETAPSQSASYSLKNAFFDFLNMFYTTILLANTFILIVWYTIQTDATTYSTTNFLLFCQSLFREIICCWNSKTRHEFFHKFWILLFLITDVT